MKTYALPVIVKKVDENLIKLDHQEELALLYYFIGSRYSEYLRKPEKGIVAVSIIYHPILTVPIADSSILLIDPVNKPIHKISYKKPILGNIIRYMKHLKNAEQELLKGEFLNILIKLRQSLEEIVKRNENIIKVKQDIEGVIADRSLIDEITKLMNYACKPYLSGIHLPEQEIDVNEVRRIYESVLKDASSLCETINLLTTEFETTYKNWRQRIEFEYLFRKREIDESLKEIKKIVTEHIAKYSTGFETEAKEIEKRLEYYKAEVNRRLKEIEKDIKEIERRLMEGEESKELRRRLRDLEKERERLKRRLAEVEERFQEEIHSIERKSSIVAEMERKRLRVIEEEANRLKRELRQIIAKCDIEYATIIKLMHGLRKEITNAYKNISKLLAPMPPLGIGRYLVPFIAVIVKEQDGVERTVLHPPQYIVLKKGVTPKYQFEKAAVLSNLISRYNGSTDKYEIKRLIKEKSLMTKEIFDEVLEGLRKFTEEERNVANIDEVVKTVLMFEKVLPPH